MSKKNVIKLLVVDDDKSHALTLRALLTEWGYQVTTVGSGEDAVELCKNTPFDLAIMDVRMTGISGIEALKEIKTYNPAIPILIMTAYSAIENAVEAIKCGAYDYLTKPLDFDELKLTLERAADHASLRSENKVLRNMLSTNVDIKKFIGQSPAMHHILEMVVNVAPSEATVLINGESGTGKELLAKLIHKNSKRHNGPYVAINCAALTETLLESELFGHEKGAFTGAEKRREGRFFAANGGTIFLDEIGEMPMSMQAKLLRAIQEREIQRVGGDKTIKVDVRILAATNKNLKEEVESGHFRQDLYYRLNVVSLKLPALRERLEDIPLLAMHFLKQHAIKNEKTIKSFTPGAMDKILKYSWPGNVRELENTVERAVVLLMGEYISERELPPNLFEESGESIAQEISFVDMTLEEIERAVVSQVVENVGGNKSEAARRLGITRKTLLTKMQNK